MYDIDHIINLLTLWGLTVEPHPCGTKDGGWIASKGDRSVQFGETGVLMTDDWSIVFDGSSDCRDSGPKLEKDRWFAGIIFAEVMT